MEKKAVEILDRKLIKWLYLTRSIHLSSLSFFCYKKTKVIHLTIKLPLIKPLKIHLLVVHHYLSTFQVSPSCWILVIPFFPIELASYEEPPPVPLLLSPTPSSSHPPSPSWCHLKIEREREKGWKDISFKNKIAKRGKEGGEWSSTFIVINDDWLVVSIKWHPLLPYISQSISC